LARANGAALQFGLSIARTNGQLDLWLQLANAPHYNQSHKAFR